jgi:serine/threonine-protein kinase
MMYSAQGTASDPTAVSRGATVRPNAGALDAPFAPGMRISDKIELVRLLGTGGMGSVWLAEHSGLETQVAVKFMSKEVLCDPALSARFAREAKLSARIKSPHVVQIFDYATTDDGIPYIVMEMLDGEDLETRLQSGRELSLEEASRVIVQLCKGLAKAHALGVVHRDIKPDNIFLVDNDGDMLVKILDFGIAKDESNVGGITVSGTTMGTPSYMSPEQVLEARDVDFRSDLWSVAVVAYRCLTGRMPFEGATFGSVCVAIHAGMFAPPSQVHPKLPPGLDAWFARALHRDKDHRFTSAFEMADLYLAELDQEGLLPWWAAARTSSGDIKTYASDPGGISGPPITLRPPSARPARRGAGTVLAVVAAIALAVLAILVDRGAERRQGNAWAGSQGLASVGLIGRAPAELRETTDLPSRRELSPLRFLPPSAPAQALRERPAAVAPPVFEIVSQPVPNSTVESVPESPADPVPATLLYGF